MPHWSDTWVGFMTASGVPGSRDAVELMPSLWRDHIRTSGGPLDGLDVKLDVGAGGGLIRLAMEVCVPLPAGTQTAAAHTGRPELSPELDQAVQALVRFARSHFALRTESGG